MTDDLDPIGFVANELAARGALIERGPDGEAAALVPPEVAVALGVPEVATLARSPGPSTVFCGLGSPLLDRLIVDARRTPVVAAVDTPEGWGGHGNLLSGGNDFRSLFYVVVLVSVCV